MKRTLTGTCLAAALGLALTASAQQPPQPQPQPQPQPTTPARSEMSTDQEKLTGCLKTGASAGTFELATSKKDKMAKHDSSTTPATPPTEAPTQDAMATAGAAKNVKLAPAPGVALAAHLNHQIEVTGSWDKTSSASPDAATSDTAKMGKTFTVSSVKMISASCTAGTY